MHQKLYFSDSLRESKSVIIDNDRLIVNLGAVVNRIDINL